MTQVKDLTELTIGELWKEVKDDKEWRDELKDTRFEGYNGWCKERWKGSY